MSKRLLILPFMLIFLFLSGCGSGQSWEDEDVSFVSHRILADDVRVVWTIANENTSRADNAALIRLKITKNNGEPVDHFDITHEKLLHLMIISKDLSYFHHVHPEYKGNGVFEIANKFPSGGEYRLIADFQPSGGDSMTKMEWVRIPGTRTQAVPVVPDDRLEHIVNGIRIQLSTDGLAANKEVTLKFSMTDEKTNQPITDLQPYLGSIGHVVVLSKDGQRYLHIHPSEGQGTGPDAEFDTEFPQSGIYKIWGQFQRNHKVFTVSYVVKVP
jgi:hypothetical protein